MAAESTSPIELFYCYARKDQDLRDELDTHLSALHRSGLVKSWYDGGITPGTPWEEEIEAHLNAANIILLLISPDFIKSDYCYSKEMTRAIARHEAGDARVLPILPRPVDWTGAPFSKLQMLPTNARPVTLWPDRDEAFKNVALEIRQVVNELIEQYKAEERMEALQRREEQRRIEALRQRQGQGGVGALRRKEAQESIEDSIKQQRQIQTQRATILSSPQQLASIPQGRTNHSSKRVNQNPWLVALALILIMGLLSAVVSSLAAPAFLHAGQLFSISSTNPIATASVPRIKVTTAASPQITPMLDFNSNDGQKELDATKSAPTISGFQRNDTWATSKTENASCTYDDTHYVAKITQAAHFVPCFSSGLSYKNFALQVTMDIKGDVGGVIFRSNSDTNTYYRLAINQVDTVRTDMPRLTLLLCNKGACSKKSTDVGTPIGSALAKVDRYPIILTAIVHDKNIDVYVNGKFVIRFTDATNTTAGQVGVYAADLSDATTVTFSDLKIWSLDK